jgi:hypothetical protein
MSKSRSPLPCPPRLQVNDPAAFYRNRRCVKHLSFAETTQPSVWEGAGTAGEATALPTPGGEIDNALQVMHLPRDDLSRVRKMIKAIDKFALVNLDKIAGSGMLELSVSDIRKRAGYEPERR